MLVGLIWGLSQGWAKMYFTPTICAGAGFLAVAFFVFFNMEWLGKVISGRAALSGLLVALMCSAAVVLWVAGVYFFTYRGAVTLPRFLGGKTVEIYKSWDVTRSRRFSLDKESIQQLGELKEPLKFVVVGRRVPGPDQENTDADTLLGLYRAARPDKVEVEHISEGDPKISVKLKNLADRVKRDPNELGWGTVVLLYGEKQFKVLRSYDLWEYRPKPYGGQVASDQVFKGEEVFTTAIYQMLDEKKPKVYFVWGHGERDPDSRDAGGMSVAAQILGRDNIEVAKLGLVSAKKIPEDASLVVVCGPGKAFTEDELGVLQNYVAENKGRLLVCLDEYRPEADVGLEPLLSAFGIQAGRDMLVEPDSDHAMPRVPDVKLSAEFGNHPVVEKLAGARLPVLFRRARTVRPVEDYAGPWRVDVLVSGSPESYGETDLDALYNRGETRYEEGKDGPKPANYAVVSWTGRAPMPGGNMAQDLGRVMVFGDSDWCSNGFLGQVAGNQGLFSAAVRWMLGQERRIVIAPKTVEEERLLLTSGQNTIAYIVLFGAPVLLGLVAGIVAWVRRR
jgi:ABC-2 type transport system permease protein